MFGKKMTNQENICNWYDRVLSITYGFLPIRKRWAVVLGKESSTCTGNLKQHQGLSRSQNPHQVEETVAKYQQEETDISNLPQDTEIFCHTCPFVAAHHSFPLPVGTSLVSRPHYIRAGMWLTEVWPSDAVSWQSECWGEAGVGGYDEEFLLWHDWGLPAAKSPGATPESPFSPVSIILWLMAGFLSILFHSGLSKRHLVPEMILAILPIKHFEISNIVQFSTCMTMN